MSAQEYGREKLSAAKNYIATSSESLRTRLKQAVVINLLELHPENLPDGCWGEFSGLLERLSRARPTDGEGSVEATLRDMPDREVEEIAGKISALHDKVASLGQRG
jgi:hypothetical protein